MDELETLTYEVDGRIARITLNRPERGNGITLEMPRELAACVERANLDPEVHAIALAGKRRASEGRALEAPEGSPIAPAVMARNHDPAAAWDPVTDFQMMSRNVRGF